MTFTQIKAAIKDYCLLTSTEADTRVGTAINRHYRRITSQLGMDATRFVTRTQATTPSGQTVTFTEIEKIDRVLDVTDVTSRRLLGERSLHELRATQPGTAPPTRWALQNTDADAVTILLDTQPSTVRSLQADGWTTLADLTGSDEPVFPESFHDVLVWFVIAEELLKKEKLQLAGTYDTKAEKLLADLRFHLADSPTRETRQASLAIGTLAGGGAAGGGGGGLTQHHTTHEPGGSDALTALSADILTSGTLPEARLSGNVALENVANVFTADQTISGAAARLHFIESDQPADARLFRLVGNDQRLYVRATNDAVTVDAATPLALDRLGHAYVGADLYEKARTTAMGHWIDVSYNAAHFTANTGTWTVAAGDVTLHAYTLIGKTLWMAFGFNGTSISVTPTELRLTIPGGFTAAKSISAPGPFYFQSAAWAIGSTTVDAGASYIRLRRDLASTPWASSTDATLLYGTAMVVIA